MVLSDLKADQPGCVLGVTDADTLGKRLLDMGFTPGALVNVLTRAPGGDTMLVELRHTAVILRREEASCVLITQANVQ